MEALETETTYWGKLLMNFKIRGRLVGGCVGFPNNREDKLPRNKFLVTVLRSQRDDPDIETSFDFYGSNYEYENGMNTLNREHLLAAFSCFVGDALAGSESFEEFCSEFGYDDDSMTAFSTYRECQKSLEKCKKLKLSETSLYNIKNDLSEKGF